jgi:hypothetical protein
MPRAAAKPTPASGIQDDESQPVPVEFDLDEWLDGAQIQQRSVVVYGRPDLVGAIEDADRRLGVAQAAADGALADPDVDAIEAELGALSDLWEASKSTWYLSGLNAERVAEVEALAPLPDVPDDPTPQQRAELEAAVNIQNLHWVANATVKIVAGNGAVKRGVTFEQVQKLAERLGTRQILALKTAAFLAQNGEPKVSVPFSRRKSENDPT